MYQFYMNSLLIYCKNVHGIGCVPKNFPSFVTCLLTQTEECPRISSKGCQGLVWIYEHNVMGSETILGSKKGIDEVSPSWKEPGL